MSGIAFDAITVTEREEGKARFTKIGVAFENKSGEGYTILLDAVPVNGKILLMKPKPKTQNPDQGGF